MSGPPPRSWAVDPDAAGARELLPGLWRLRVPVGWEEFDHVNAYAIEHGEGFVLVDCGTGGDPSCLLALDRALADAGIRLGEVTDLVITHAHSDHAGLAAPLRRDQPITIWGHPADHHSYSVLADPDGTYARRAALARLAGVPENRLPAFADVREETEGFSGIAHPDRELREGDAVPSGLGDWRVIEAPGHAPSQICLVQPDLGVAIVADLLCAVYITWLEYGWSQDPAGEHRRSFDRIAAAGPLDLVLPGHGRPIDAVGELLAAHQSEWETRLGAMPTALEAGPADAYELADRAYGIDSVGDVAAVEKLGAALSYLRHLRLAGAVGREVDSAGRYSYRLTAEAPLAQ